MPEGRPAIPAELERAVMVEAGHRCAIPTCRAVAPLQIDHIDDWAQVQEHRFENLIVLCANCHGLKGEGPRRLDRRSLKQYKANLAVLNGRYSDFERRVLVYIACAPDETRVLLPAGMDLLVMDLVNDGYLIPGKVWYTKSFFEPVSFALAATREYLITQDARELVQRWKDAQPLD
ncbi:HNH endonuclease [Nonomuraea bangladeshensis]